MQYDHDVIVIGGGAAGLVVATGTASLGADTALIEKSKLGGDCTWYGCIPSKAILKAAQVVSLIGRAGDFGVSLPEGIRPDTGKVMDHVRDMVRKISEHHPPEVFEKRGVKILFGAPVFEGPRAVMLNGKRITAKRFIVCPGSHPMVPTIEGLGDIDYLTNENVFDLETLPGSMAVLGGGPIGVELSQAFSRLGVKVTIVEMMDSLLFREDPEIAAVLAGRLAAEGIEIETGQKAIKFSRNGSGTDIVLEGKKGERKTITTDKVLVAVGRAPNVEGLALEKAGVKYSKKGIGVDDTLRTSAKNIYACGDAAGPYQFSHMAEYQAIIVIGNALMPFNRKVGQEVVPWCTFTEPEVARVGLTEAEAREKYKDVRVYRSEYSGNDRAVTDGEEAGIVKAVCDGKGRILGAHIVGAGAGEIIHEYVLAMSAGLNIGKISAAIHVYPTLAQTAKRAADHSFDAFLGSRWFKVFTKTMLKFLK